MQQERHNLHALFQRNDVAFEFIGDHVLLGARLAHHHRVDDFQVRRVGGQRHVHLVAVELAVRRGTEVILDVARALDFVGLERTALELVEHGPVRLRHHLGQHVEAAAVGHAEDDFLQPHIAAALDDLLQRRDQRFTAVEAKPLGALVLDVDELLEAFRLDQLLQDRLLAHVGKVDALVGAFDPLLDPGFLFRIGDVHELDAQRRAIGPLEDVEHLRNRRIFKPENMVDEDRPLEIGFGKAIGFRRKLVVIIVGLLRQIERIELGMQMAAHAVGADHHQRLDRIARGLGDVARLRRPGGSLGLELVGHRLLDFAPVAVERRDQFAIGLNRPVGLLPGSAGGGLADLVRIVFQLCKERLPFGWRAARIVLKPCVHLLDIGSIAAIQKRGLCHDVVGFVFACHGSHLLRGPFFRALFLDSEACAALKPRQTCPTLFPTLPCR